MSGQVRLIASPLSTATMALHQPSCDSPFFGLLPRRSRWVMRRMLFLAIALVLIAQLLFSGIGVSNLRLGNADGSTRVTLPDHPVCFAMDLPTIQLAERGKQSWEPNTEVELVAGHHDFSALQTAHRWSSVQAASVDSYRLATLLALHVRLQV